MKKLLLFIVALMLTAPIFGQNNKVKKIVALETVDIKGVVERGDLLMISNTIADILKDYAGYKVYDRTDISAILDEQEFQKLKIVDKKQIKEVGKLVGADFVLYTEIAPRANGGMYIYGKLMNVETGEWELNGDATAKSVYEIEDALNVLIRDMLDKNTGSRNNNSTYNPYVGGRDFVETTAGLNMKMVWVEGGPFMMGATSEQGSDAASDEQVIRRVTLDSYYIAECEVTQSQWEKVMGTSIQQQASRAGYSTCGVGSDYPMYCVSWEEAQAFCDELSSMTGRTYRLPTEAQWEYAARGGKNADGKKYSGSNSIDAVAWYWDNSGKSTHPVKYKRANGLGLYDMSGNVWEWCSDWYHETYNVNDTNNPTGPSSGSYRVVRGGSWGGDARYCRVSNRGCYAPGRRGSYGFRVVVIP